MNRRLMRWSAVAALVAAAGVTVGTDIALSSGWEGEDSFLLVDAVSAATRSGMSVVGMITSEYQRLDSPVGRDAELSEAQVEDMVRYAVAMAGGLHQRIEPDAEWIVIKPNIVELKERGSGVITDWRVVKALIKMVNEVVPEARITIAEGAVWVPPDKEDVISTGFGGDVGDGFALAGFRPLLDDPELEGVDLDIIDLNYDEAVEVEVPEGGYVRDTYHFPLTVLECDFLISVPVLKVIAAVGMTNAMKNLVGVAPGMVYGFPKMAGYPGSGVAGLPHNPGILDEVIVDLVALAEPDFAVVDAIVGMERAKTDDDGGVPVRLNTIVAGPDIVAVDAVSAQLIGLNPDDIEYITLGAYKGLGQGDLANIKVKGSDLIWAVRRFEKDHGGSRYYGDHGSYGQGCRTWLLRGPFELQDARPGQESVDVTAPQAIPGQNGWSQAVYFHDDKIDLDKYYDDPFDCSVYAFATFTAQQDGEAELWVGSDEGMGVWINGQQVYEHDGRRSHRLPCDRVKIQVTAGENALLVRVDQSRSRFDFSLNICEVEADKRYAGNRLWGLRFAVPSLPEAPEVDGFAELDFDADQEAARDGAVVLEGAEFVRSPDLLAGSLEGALRYTGAEPEPIYLLGTTGHAFRFSVADSLEMEGCLYTDVSAHAELYQNLGHEVRLITAAEDAADLWDRQQEAWDAIVESIDGGVPAVARIGPYFCAVNGYHAKGEQVLTVTFRGGNAVQADELGTDQELGGLDVLIFGKPRAADAASTARSVIQLAVAQARAEPRGSVHYGLDGYQHWAREIENGNVGHGSGMPLATGQITQRRAQAAPYLRHVAASFSADVAAQVEAAARCYAAEMEPLNELSEMFRFAERHGQGADLEDPATSSKVVALIGQARDWDEQAVRHLEEALALLAAE